MESRYKKKPLLARPFIALRCAFAGLAAAWRHEVPFRLEVIAQNDPPIARDELAVSTSMVVAIATGVGPARSMSYLARDTARGFMPRSRCGPVVSCVRSSQATSLSIAGRGRE